MFYLISNQLNNVSKRDCNQFCVKNLKMKRKKGQNLFDLPERGFEPQVLQQFSRPRSEFSWKVREAR
jgi:hypothetical protein